MGLLSRASTLDKIEKNPELAFSDFRNKHSLKRCALLEKEASNYIVTNSIGFDAPSIISATSTIDFWNGICKSEGQIYNYNETDITHLLQLFSFKMKDNIENLSVYKNSSAKILLYEGNITETAARDFENICDKSHNNNILTLNPLLKNGTVVLKFEIDINDAAKEIYNSNNKNEVLTPDLFLKAILNEVYNRYACRYNISDTTIKNNKHSIKTVIFTDKTYSADLISRHMILNLKEVFDNFSERLKITCLGTADSCEEIQSFLQAD